MTPIISIILLSTIISPMGNLTFMFKVSGSSPVCGQTVSVVVSVMNDNDTVVVSYSKVYHYTVNEVSSGKISGNVSVPLNLIDPGTYYAKIKVGYCGVEKIETIPFVLGGVVLDGYTATVLSDGIIFDLQFRNTDVNKHIIFVKARIKTDAGYKTAIVSEEVIPANTSVVVPVNVTVRGLPGSYANVSVGYIYLGKYYYVDSQTIPIPSEARSEGQSVSTTVIIFLITLLFVAVIVSKA